jgi:dihydroxyacetone kinase-like protein
MGISVTDVKNSIKSLSEVIIRNEVLFCELDSVAGDGDFGMSLSKGFKEVLKNLDEFSSEDVGMFLNDCAMVVYEYCGGASGPIWGSALKAAAISAKGKTELSNDDIVELFECAIDGIQKKGGASLGDKTLLDALIPATMALKAAITTGSVLKDSFIDAAKSAVDGAEMTKLIIAKKGRATYLGERSINYPDAGAMAISIIFNEMLANE